MLVHVIDAATGELDEHYATIRAELSSYGAGLDELPEVVVLNKIDLLLEPPSFEPPGTLAVFPLSCATGEGVEAFRRALFSLVPPLPEEQPSEPEMAEYLVYRPKPKRPSFRILRTDRGYRVAGTAPSRAELEEALRQAGARSGDEVVVGDETLEYH
jgi:50S ribosomal subunit-associated GTPase HflX